MKLHIGCKGPKIEGFTRVDVTQWGDVDIVTDAQDLNMIKDGEADEIYVSHILEHFSHRKTLDVLREWGRVLKKGGIAYLSVPDFDRLVDLYLASGRMLGQFIQDWNHGGQNYEKDVHQRSFTFPVLAGLMSQAGFSRIERLDYLPYNLGDCSTLTDNFQNKPISVNVKGIK